MQHALLEIFSYDKKNEFMETENMIVFPCYALSALLKVVSISLIKLQRLGIVN